MSRITLTIADFGVLVAILGLFAALFTAGFVNSAAEREQLRARLRTLEALHHSHKPDGSPVYPPAWRPR